MGRNFIIKKTAILLFGSLLISGFARTSLAADTGAQSYKNGKYDKAVEYYQKLLKEKDIPQASYNLGNSLYKSGKYDDAVEAFEQSLGVENDQQKFRAMYNLGNALAKAKKLKLSAAFYRRALELDPKDYDAKYNLEMVNRMMQQQQKQQKQNSKNDQNQKNKKKQQQKQNKDQQKQDQKKNQSQNKQDQNQQQKNQKQQQDQQQKNQQGQKKQDQEKKQQQQQAQQQKNQQAAGDSTRQAMAKNSEKSLDKQEAAQILNALRLDQDKVMKAQIQKKLEKRKLEKDW